MQAGYRPHVCSVCFEVSNDLKCGLRRNWNSQRTDVIDVIGKLKRLLLRFICSCDLAFVFSDKKQQPENPQTPKR